MPSSVIRWFTYDADSRELRVIFVTGRVYVYDDVPQDVYEDFKSAFSKGEFFNSHVRDAYRYREITPVQ